MTERDNYEALRQLELDDLEFCSTMLRKNLIERGFNQDEVDDRIEAFKAVQMYNWEENYNGTNDFISRTFYDRKTNG